MAKAYSTLTIKSVTDTDDERIITGIATTPSTDRDDDILEPAGAKFALPIPLLWQHNHNQPIGEVISATVTDKGIEITAKIAKIADDGKLKDRLDEAWQSIKSGEPHIMVLRSGRKVVVQRGLLRSAIRKRKVPKCEMGELGGHGVAMGIYVGKGTKQKEYPNYWHFVEYGTSKMSAVPFLRPAFDKNVNLALDIFTKKLSDEIDKIIK